jgi:hypothetical protein
LRLAHTLCSSARIVTTSRRMAVRSQIMKTSLETRRTQMGCLGCLQSCLHWRCYWSSCLPALLACLRCGPAPPQMQASLVRRGPSSRGVAASHYPVGSSVHHSCLHGCECQRCCWRRCFRSYSLARAACHGTRARARQAASLPYHCQLAPVAKTIDANALMVCTAPGRRRHASGGRMSHDRMPFAVPAPRRRVTACSSVN